jgi:hypothetical protein
MTVIEIRPSGVLELERVTRESIALPKYRMIRHNSCHAVQEERKD